MSMENMPTNGGQITPPVGTRGAFLTLVLLAACCCRLYPQLVQTTAPDSSALPQPGHPALTAICEGGASAISSSRMFIKPSSPSSAISGSGFDAGLGVGLARELGGTEVVATGLDFTFA